MRLAVCIHGIVGGKKGKDNAGGALDIHELFSHFRDNVIAANEGDFEKIDVFIHSWSVDQKDSILSLYDPTSHVIENQIVFEGVSQEDQRRFSKFYSLYKSINMCEKYCNDDIILSCRFDMFYNKQLKINDIIAENSQKARVYFPGDNPEWNTLYDDSKRLADDFIIGKKGDIFDFFSNDAKKNLDNRMLNRAPSVLNPRPHRNGLDNHHIVFSIFQENIKQIEIVRLSEYTSRVDLIPFRESHKLKSESSNTRII
tara:strand:- start:32552 stop:33319 length:768 start_codon:yes stop_codon:yes gene_type:complete